MEPTQFTYPVFEANQVLTNAHLNGVFNYLDEQTRLTRANLIGLGVVCGLSVQQRTVAGNPVIHISKGCGITSEGYLIEQLEEVELVAFRSYTPPTKEPFNYPAFKSTGASAADTLFLPLWELFNADEPNTTLLGAETGFLTDKVVLAFLELNEKNLRNCSPNDCADRGTEVNVTLRFLLIGQTDADRLLNESALHTFDEQVAALPEIPLPRPNFSTPSALQQVEQTYRAYFAATVRGTESSVVSRLKAGLMALKTALDAQLGDLTDGGLSDLEARLALPASPFVPIQYYYALLRDLTAAYHELRDVLQSQPAFCLPAKPEFPRHLLLGALTEATNGTYRTPYYPAPSVASPGHTPARIRFLFERINQMILSFQVPAVADQTPLRITPSSFGGRYLSGRAMPYYYAGELRNRWDAHRNRTVLSWHITDTDTDHVRNPLDYTLEPYNFYRFEGHIGKNAVTMSDTINTMLRDSRLAVSVLYLNANALGRFLERHRSIEHEGGAIRGGTLVVLNGATGNNTVVADFMLPYRIEDRETSSLGRVQVRECAYEWFDSRQHVANLVQRDYRFGSRPGRAGQRTARELLRDQLDDSYIIRVYSYVIQGVNLIQRPTDVVVPIPEVQRAGLSAIARALNGAFPGGVVFDHRPNTNKLIIRYFDDQTFRIEWGGLQGNQIRYAYSNGLIQKRLKNVWDDLPKSSLYGVTCRLLNNYRADEYRWLQNDDGYGAAYPAPAPMATAKDLIEWEKLMVKRAREFNTQGKLPIANLLSRVVQIMGSTFVANSVFNANRPAKLVSEGVLLVGSWANGAWVSREPGRRYPAGFMELRQKVTGNTGPSRIDLLVQKTAGSPITAEIIIAELNRQLGTDRLGYEFNVVFGRKDAQKGLAIR